MDNQKTSVKDYRKQRNKQTNKPKQNKTPLTKIKHTQFLIE